MKLGSIELHQDLLETPGMLVPEEAKSKTREYMPLYKLGEIWDIAMAALLRLPMQVCLHGITRSCAVALSIHWESSG